MTPCRGFNKQWAMNENPLPIVFKFVAHRIVVRCPTNANPLPEELQFVAQRTQK